MLSTWLVASLTVFSGPLAECQTLDSPAITDRAIRSDLEELYHQGRTYIEFRDAAERRVEAWNDHYAQAQVPDALLTRLAAVPGTWHLLVVAEDWCGDSANTIPYVAKLDDVADNLAMRIIDSDVGRTIMEAHPTPDGRAATPTVILLTDDFEEAGCFVERPHILQDWWLESEETLQPEERLDQKYAWYDEDQGQETLKEIVELIEAAAAGRAICRS
jgi:hypothetical protein